MKQGTDEMNDSTTIEESRPASIPLPVKLLGMAHLFLGMGGIMGGYFLTSDPTGRRMGVSVELLEKLPISDFIIPGLVLLVILGALPFFTIYSLWLLPAKNQSLLGYHWSWWLSGGVGLFLIGWTTGEIILWGWVGLSIGYCILGAVIFAGGFSKTIRQHCSVK